MWIVAAYVVNVIGSVQLKVPIEFVKLVSIAPAQLSPPIIAPTKPFFVYDASIIAPQQIEVFTNESMSFYVVIKNVGNGTLTEICLNVKNYTRMRMRNNYTTSRKKELEPTATLEFKVEISPAKSGNYTIIFTLTSKQVTKETSILFKVRKLLERVAAEWLIKGAERMIQEREGKFNLSEAHRLLAKAKEAFVRGEYEKAKQLAQAAIEAAEAAQPLPQPIVWWIWLLIIALISTGIFLLYYLRKGAKMPLQGEEDMLRKIKKTRNKVQKLKLKRASV